METNEREDYSRILKPLGNGPSFAAIGTIVATMLLGGVTWALSTITDMRRDMDRTIERQNTVLKTNQDQETEIRDLEKRVRNLEYWIRPAEKGERP